MLTDNELLEPEAQQIPYELVQASTGKRFANYLIDSMVFLLIIFFWAVIVAIVWPETLEAIDDSAFGSFGERIISMIVYAIIMSLIEGIFHGKSLGKLITGTKAVNNNGSDISFGTALARGCTRAVPFDAFSALGRPCFPWHDKWTNTLVIDEKATRLHNEQLELSSKIELLQVTF